MYGTALAADREEEEDLAAYYDACQSATSSSASSSRATSPTNVGAEPHTRKRSSNVDGSHTNIGTAAFTPLQGGVSRPLLQRQRCSGSGETISPLHGRGNENRVHSIAPAVRGAAGEAFARQLQHASLPVTPAFVETTSAGALLQKRSTEAVNEATEALQDVVRAFAFHAMPSAPQREANTTIIKTRGRNAGGTATPMSPHASAQAPASSVTVCARQRAVLFDVLCALRQQPTASCVGPSSCSPGANPASSSSSSSSTVSWRLRDSALAEACRDRWPQGFLAALDRLLSVATTMADVEQRCERLRAAVAAHSKTASALDGNEVLEAPLALESAGLRTLLRLQLVLRALTSDFRRWVLRVMEQLLSICHMRDSGGAARWRDEEDEEDGCGARDAGLLLPVSFSVLRMVAAVEANALPLHRCLVLMEDSGCCEGCSIISSATAPSTASTPSKASSLSFAALAGRLLDTLIIQASAVQDTATMDLYRFYVLLLLHLTWPYVLLCTAAIFGFVRHIDPPLWRRRLPRLFRSSFSHVRVGDAHRQYPTDVLSLLLNCVGYEDAPADSTMVAGGKERAGWGAARSALTSSRRFVLCSLETFTRQKKQVALSRTPAAPSTAATIIDGKDPPVRDTRGDGGSAKAWQKKSVKEILHYILYESGQPKRGLTNRDGGDASHSEYNKETAQAYTHWTQHPVPSGAAVVAYARANQDVRHRLVQVPSTISSSTHASRGAIQADADGFWYYPTTIPLAFAGMAAEALPGQLQWQHTRDRTLRGERNGCASTGEEDEEDEEDSEDHNRIDGNEEGSGEDTAVARGRRKAKYRVLHRRLISLWTLCLSESATAPDVCFVNINALTSHTEGDVAECEEDGVQQRRDRHGRRPHSHHRPHTPSMWMNVTIPCARWVTTALLIPIGVAVQRLQERRLRDLLTMTLRPSPASGRAGNSATCAASGGDDLLENARRVQDDVPVLASPMDPSTTALNARYAVAATSCTFLHVLKLVVDVALCRDTERIVFGFVERLYHTPHWWTRRWSDGGRDAYARLGTASPTVSTIFAEALRGKRLSSLVRLRVLPSKTTGMSMAPSLTGAGGGPAEAARSDPGTSSTVAGTMLDLFASMQLEFTLPAAFGLMLLPRDLSVHVHPITGATERSYQTFFWQRRRRLYVEETSTVTTTATLPHALKKEEEVEHTNSGGIAFADVWSYLFGYQCSLHYAQITLREHKRELHQRDTQDFQVAQVMGPPGTDAARHLQYVARGLGSAYHTLHFAVDTVLAFTEMAAMQAVYELERLLQSALRSSPELHSCIELCHALDTVLLRLQLIAFPARLPVTMNAREAAVQSPAGEGVRAAVRRLLDVAVDPSRLPVSYIRTTTRGAVEALVAAVSAAAEHQTVLAMHLQPLRVLLTFNRYYGSETETLSYRFR